MIIRVVVVDDEPLARLGVTTRLQQHSDIRILAECASGAEANLAIQHWKPDLIFLDVEMPGMSGLDVLHALPKEVVPRVIFLTAFEDYAVEAFEMEAIDYLLKPIDEARFESSLSRARRVLRLDRYVDKYGLLDKSIRTESDQNESLLSRRFAIRQGRKLSFVELADVSWIEGLGDYAGLHVNGRTHLIRESLTSLALRLDRQQFVRIHRSTIVRIDRIVQIESLANRDFLVTLSDQSKVRSSRTYSSALRSLLQNKHGLS